MKTIIMYYSFKKDLEKKCNTFKQIIRILLSLDLINNQLKAQILRNSSQNMAELEKG